MAKVGAPGATRTRTETESMGAIEVPADRYWGAQTQRSLVQRPWWSLLPKNVNRRLA